MVPAMTEQAPQSKRFRRYLWANGEIPRWKQLYRCGHPFIYG